MLSKKLGWAFTRTRWPEPGKARVIWWSLKGKKIRGDHRRGRGQRDY